MVEDFASGLLVSAVRHVLAEEGLAPAVPPPSGALVPLEVKRRLLAGPGSSFHHDRRGGTIADASLACQGAVESGWPVQPYGVGTTRGAIQWHWVRLRAPQHRRQRSRCSMPLLAAAMNIRVEGLPTSARPAGTTTGESGSPHHTPPPTEAGSAW